MKQRAVFLDRDGVLNRAVIKEGKPYPPASIEEMEIIAGVSEALSALKQAGYLCIVATNQPDVARGLTSELQVRQMNDWLKSQLALDAVFTCFHDTKDQCDCRKPKPGLLIEAAHTYGIDLKRSFMVGDRWRDVEAGNQAGCKTFFIDYGYSEKQPLSFHYRVASLLEASRIILAQKENINDSD